MDESAALAWDGVVVTTTRRLLLRTFRRDDLPRYAVMNSDPEVARYLGGPIDRQESDEIAEWAQQVYAAEGIGLLAVERRSGCAFLGMCGLHHLNWYPDDVELGYRLAREHWGQGYATEAGRAWLDFGFRTLELARIISVSDAPNQRSIAVSRRLGMTFDHETDLVEDGALFHAVIHAITAEQWTQREPEREPGCER